MSTIATPTLPQFGELLEALLGRDVSARAGKTIAPDEKGGTVVGLYRDEEGALGAVVVAQTALACYVGAALTLIPAASTNEHVKIGELPESLCENFQEVLNVSAQMFNASHTARQILREVIRHPESDLPEDAAALIEESENRVDTAVMVDGYGGGGLSIYLR